MSDASDDLHQAFDDLHQNMVECAEELRAVKRLTVHLGTTIMLLMAIAIVVILTKPV